MGNEEVTREVEGKQNIVIAYEPDRGYFANLLGTRRHAYGSSKAEALGKLMLNLHDGFVESTFHIIIEDNVAATAPEHDKNST